MSDVSQGPGWWQASDGKWYPPEQAPGAQPTSAPPTTPPTTPPTPGGPSPGGPPPGGYAQQPGGFDQGGSRATFSVGDAFNWGFKKFQENLGPILIAAVIIFVAVIVIEVIFWFILSGALLASTETHTTDFGTTYTTTSGGGFVMTLLFGAIMALILYVGLFLVQMAIIRATLMITNGEELSLNRMFSTDQIGPYLVASVLVAIGVAIGSFFCYIPGLIVWFFTFFFGWFVIDKKMGAVDAIKASANLVNQNMGTMVGFFIGALIATFIGAILCGIGLIVAYPVVVLATGYVYKRTQGEAVAA